MPVDYEYRYRKCIDMMQRAEKEIVRLRSELAAQKKANAIIGIIAEEAISALEALGKHNQA